MAETDLYLPVKAFLERQGYRVKGEIGECDVLALRGDEPPLIVELKSGFTLQLLLQGIDRQVVSDAVYLAIAAPKRRQTGDIVRLCRRLGLGLLIVRDSRVEALADPLPYQPRKNSRRQSLLLKEFAARIGDPHAGGSASGPRMTAYRQDALRCARHLVHNGPCKVSHVRQQAAVSRAATILHANVYGWFAREQRGIYALTEAGSSAVAQFQASMSGW